MATLKDTTIQGDLTVKGELLDSGKFRGALYESLTGTTGISSTAPIRWLTEIFRNPDFISAYNQTTGVFTIAKSGIYRITSNILISGGDNNSYIHMQVYVNGSWYRSMMTTYSTTALGNYRSFNRAMYIPLKAGDELHIIMNQSTGTGTYNYYVSTTYDKFSIEWRGRMD